MLLQYRAADTVLFVTSSETGTEVVSRAIFNSTPPVTALSDTGDLSVFTA